jgi:hypothetical protein
MRRRSSLTGKSALCVAVAVGLLATDVAADEKTECAGAHASGQRLQRDGHLREAQQRYEFCARDRCPAIITKDCNDFLGKLEPDVPTVVIGARDRSRRDTLEVRVLVDGEAVADRLTGLALPLDPGQHVLRFVDPQGSVLEETIVARVGEKNRPLLVDFSKPPALEAVPPPQERAPAASGERPSSPAPRPIPRSVFLLGGASVLTLGSFAFFGLSALAKAHDLESTCAPDCGSRMNEIHTMRVEGVVADVSLGASAVLLGTATALFFTRHRALGSGATGYLAPAPHGGTGMLAVAF